MGKRSESKIMQDIIGCYCALSPENVWCDGEATPEQAQKTVRKIKGELEILFTELGRRVSETEALTYGR